MPSLDNRAMPPQAGECSIHRGMKKGLCPCPKDEDSEDEQQEFNKDKDKVTSNQNAISTNLTSPLASAPAPHAGSILLQGLQLQQLKPQHIAVDEEQQTEAKDMGKVVLVANGPLTAEQHREFDKLADHLAGAILREHNQLLVENNLRPSPENNLKVDFSKDNDGHVASLTITAPNAKLSEQLMQRLDDKGLLPSAIKQAHQDMLKGQDAQASVAAAPKPDATNTTSSPFAVKAPQPGPMGM